jgi:hypothetical protein
MIIAKCMGKLMFLLKVVRSQVSFKPTAPFAVAAMDRCQVFQMELYHYQPMKNGVNGCFTGEGATSKDFLLRILAFELNCWHYSG